jgi:hypothetical protein
MDTKFVYNNLDISPEIWCETSEGICQPELVKQVFNESKAISVDTTFAQTEFYYGEEFSIAGLTVSGSYKDAVDSFVIGEYKYNAEKYNKDKLGVYNIDITGIKGFHCSYSVSVRKIKVIGSYQEILLPNPSPYSPGANLTNLYRLP